MIVRACRRYLRAFFGVSNREAVERGLWFARKAETSWKRGGGELASTLNYALVRPTTTKKHVWFLEPVVELGKKFVNKGFRVDASILEAYFWECRREKGRGG